MSMRQQLAQRQSSIVQLPYNSDNQKAEDQTTLLDYDKFLPYSNATLCQILLEHIRICFYKPLLPYLLSAFLWDNRTTVSTDATFSLKASMTSSLTGNAYFISFIGFFPSSHGFHQHTSHSIIQF